MASSVLSNAEGISPVYILPDDPPDSEAELVGKVKNEPGVHDPLKTEILEDIKQEPDDPVAVHSSKASTAAVDALPETGIFGKVHNGPYEDDRLKTGTWMRVKKELDDPETSQPSSVTAAVPPSDISELGISAEVKKEHIDVASSSETSDDLTDLGAMDRSHCCGQEPGCASVTQKKGYIGERASHRRERGNATTYDSNELGDPGDAVEPCQKCSGSDECGKTSARQKYRVSHKLVILVHSELHRCDMCEKTFKKQHHLARHKVTHSADKPHKCDDCCKTFAARDYLVSHRRTHLAEKPHRCDDCGKTFARRDGLACHKRLHTGDKPYRCDDCGKTFTRREGLVCHKRTHTGEKPYRCDVCGKAFAERRHIRQHTRRHSGEKPYKCDDCGKAYVEKRSLVRHRDTHRQKPYIRPLRKSVC